MSNNRNVRPVSFATAIVKPGRSAPFRFGQALRKWADIQLFRNVSGWELPDGTTCWGRTWFSSHSYCACREVGRFDSKIAVKVIDLIVVFRF